MNKFKVFAAIAALALAFSLPASAAELRLAQVADVSSLDTQKVSDVYSANVIRQIYSNLVQVNEKMEIVPDLAESWENPDDVTWVFHLRKGVKFHNGEPFTAADVKYTFGRLDPKTASRRHPPQGSGSMEAVDDHTIRIVTRRPFAPMLMSLTRYETAILNQKAVEAAGADYGSKAAVGTGPFKFESWSGATRLFWSERRLLEALQEWKSWCTGASPRTPPGSWSSSRAGSTSSPATFPTRSSPT